MMNSESLMAVSLNARFYNLRGDTLLLTHDKARRIAANIEKLPKLLQKKV
jgi:hypothetical protein